MSVAAQQHAKIVERRHNASQFHAVDKEDRERDLGLPDRIQKQILKILRTFRHCFYLSLIPVGPLANAPNSLSMSSTEPSFARGNGKQTRQFESRSLAVIRRRFFRNVKKSLAQGKCH